MSYEYEKNFTLLLNEKIKYEHKIANYREVIDKLGQFLNYNLKDNLNYNSNFIDKLFSEFNYCLRDLNKAAFHLDKIISSFD